MKATLQRARTTPPSNRKPYLSYSLAIDYFAERNPKLIAHAFREFITQVDPDIDEDDNLAEDMLQSLCLEWFLFDFKLEDGTTPLERLVEAAPAGITKKELDEFRQSAETHLSSTFLVVGVHPALSLVTLEDLSTGQRYPVTDASLSHSLPDDGGIIGARLVYVDGTWYFPGNPAFYYPVVPTKRMLEMLRENANPEERFIDLARSRYGRKDPEGGRPPVMAAAPQSAEERHALLEELESRYAALADFEGLPVTWSELANAIKTENGQIMPTDLLRDLLANDKGEVDVSGEEALEELVYIFSNAWNNLPHDSLGGKRPAGMYGA